MDRPISKPPNLALGVIEPIQFGLSDLAEPDFNFCSAVKSLSKNSSLVSVPLTSSTAISPYCSSLTAIKYLGFFSRLITAFTFDRSFERFLSEAITSREIPRSFAAACMVPETLLQNPLSLNPGLIKTTSLALAG